MKPPLLHVEKRHPCWRCGVPVTEEEWVMDHRECRYPSKRRRFTARHAIIGLAIFWGGVNIPYVLSMIF